MALGTLLLLAFYRFYFVVRLKLGEKATKSYKYLYQAINEFFRF